MITSTAASKSISDSELDELLEMPTSDSVITPTVSNLLSKETDDFEGDFSKEKVVNVKEKTTTEASVTKVTDKELEDSIDPLLEGNTEEGAVDTTKTVNSDFVEDLIKDGTFLLFDDDKSWSDYSEKDKKELIKANLERVRAEEAEKAPTEFFDSLPPELQYAANYIANGGKNLKSLFKALSGLEETKELDIKTPEGQEETVRKFLLVSNFGTHEEVEEEISSLRDMPGALEKKATQYKPKLDAKQQELVDKQLKDQEEFRKKQELLATKYKESVLAAIQPGEIGGIKITPTTQNMLFQGLTDVNYQSASGRPTNLFGHLLEQHQYVKPNPTLMAQVLWLMKDEEGYKNAVKKIAKEEATADTVRQLKTTASERPSSAIPATTKNAGRTIPKQKANPFQVRT